MSSLMMKAAMVLFASLLSGGKPSAAKNRADAARSLTGRLTAILVDIGASVVVAGGCCLLANAVSGGAGDVACTLCLWPSPNRCAACGRRAAASWRSDRGVTGALGGAGLGPAGSRIGYGTVLGGTGNASVTWPPRSGMQTSLLVVTSAGVRPPCLG